MRSIAVPGRAAQQVNQDDIKARLRAMNHQFFNAKESSL